MARRCDGHDLPPYFIGPTRKPAVHQTGIETAEQIAWDQMCGCWPTTAEWLAWVRRRDGRKMYWSKRGWHYPMRPIIAAHVIPWTTRKLRKLPAIRAQGNKHEDWCASLNVLLTSNPPKPAPCNCGKDD